MFHDKTRNMLQFDSITEMATVVNERLPHDGHYLGGQPNKFFGADTWAELKMRCAVGDDRTVPAAERMMKQIETQFASLSSKPHYDVYGDFPDVADYLAGEPECMVSMEQVRNNASPLSIYMDLTTSAGITPEQYRRRGIAVLALAIQLSASRPINLHVCTLMDAYDCQVKGTTFKDGESYSIVTARVETAPLDIGRAALMMTNVGIPRRMFYGIAKFELGFDYSWPQFVNSSGCQIKTASAEYVEYVRDLLSIGEETLYIPPVFGFVGEAKQMVEQPVEWINTMLKKYGPCAAEEE